MPSYKGYDTTHESNVASVANAWQGLQAPFLHSVLSGKGKKNPLQALPALYFAFVAFDWFLFLGVSLARLDQLPRKSLVMSKNGEKISLASLVPCLLALAYSCDGSHPCPSYTAYMG